MVAAASLNASGLIRYCTRFTEDVFNALLAFNFLSEAARSLLAEVSAAPDCSRLLLMAPDCSRLLRMASDRFGSLWSASGFFAEGSVAPDRVEAHPSLPHPLLCAVALLLSHTRPRHASLLCSSKVPPLRRTGCSP